MGKKKSFWESLPPVLQDQRGFASPSTKTKTQTKTSTRTKVIATVAILGVLGIAAYGMVPGVKKNVDYGYKKINKVTKDSYGKYILRKPVVQKTLPTISTDQFSETIKKETTGFTCTSISASVSPTYRPGIFEPSSAPEIGRFILTASPSGCSTELVNLTFTVDTSFLNPTPQTIRILKAGVAGTILTDSIPARAPGSRSLYGFTIRPTSGDSKFQFTPGTSQMEFLITADTRQMSDRSNIRSMFTSGTFKSTAGANQEIGTSGYGGYHNVRVPTITTPTSSPTSTMPTTITPTSSPTSTMPTTITPTSSPTST